MKAWIGICLLAAASTGSWAVAPEDVLASSATHFPKVLESLAKQRAAAAGVLAAEGAYDIRLYGDGLGFASGFYDGVSVESGAKRYLSNNGGSVYGGYRISNGDFPIYEDYAFTNTGGEAKAGVILALLRDRLIDDRRFSITDARLSVEQADLELLLTQLEVQLSALKAYWYWVTSGTQLGVYKDLLDIAQLRQTGLEEEVRQGAKARIYLTENQQNITRRMALVRRAERDFIARANSLSLYLRDPAGAPLVPASDQLPDVDIGQLPPIPSVNTARLTEMVRDRPEMNLLVTAIQRVENEVNLKRNDLQPRLDLSLEVSHDFGAIAEGGSSRDSTDTIIGLEFSVPLERRKARGELRVAEAKLEALRLEAQQTTEQMAIALRNILLDLETAQDLLQLAELEVEQSEALMRAEQKRFESGASDFFLVNVREQAAADARTKLFDAYLQFQLARASYQAATMDAAALGLSSR